MNTIVNFAGIKMKNPVTVASGSFGYGEEFSEFFDLNLLGGIFTKGTTLKARQGNPPPRLIETPSGMLNAIGMQNPGVEYVVEHYLPKLRRFNAAIIVNVGGSTLQEYTEVCRILNNTDINGVELNLSCPNTKYGCMEFGLSYEGIKSVTSLVRKVLDKPLIVKLSPNVTDIGLMAKAAEDGGADGISLINTFKAMVIDINTMRPILGNNTGGLSGPAIRPIAVKMTYDVAKSTQLPVLSSGGIVKGTDAIEYMLAGATAVSIAIGNFYQSDMCLKVIKEIKNYMQEKNINDINQIIGKVQMNRGV